jgi:hypothetical protein
MSKAEAEANNITPMNATGNVITNQEHNYFVLPLPAGSAIGSQFICNPN